MQTIGILARLGGAELAALVGGAIFVVIMGFLLFWGGRPGSQR